MNNIRTVNLATYSPHSLRRKPEILIPCDRRTPLGNPYQIATHNIQTRNESIARFAASFSTIISHPAAKSYFNLIRDALLISDVALGCHCYPDPCHTSVIIDYLKSHPDTRRMHALIDDQINQLSSVLNNKGDSPT
jgi:hypothetical protein